ncbi:hypothetical protein LV564_06390 [Komagataeibacter nataicola]|uniref:hypothetical protein n=1 Tax=Komagataeibacter nataicola TaxID=265960 RepID=UPI001428D6BD|nr:hypothetical protein [Komagataeibacter nataicola]WEQ56698.1 hypothetical protein LV564_06390 [Komagataeibacter nataicola]
MVQQSPVSERVNAVLHALDGQIPQAFYDTVYKAHAAMGDCSQIEAIWARHGM